MDLVEEFLELTRNVPRLILMFYGFEFESQMTLCFWMHKLDCGIC